MGALAASNKQFSMLCVPSIIIIIKFEQNTQKWMFGLKIASADDVCDS